MSESNTWWYYHTGNGYALKTTENVGASVLICDDENLSKWFCKRINFAENTIKFFDNILEKGEISMAETLKFCLDNKLII